MIKQKGFIDCKIEWLFYLFVLLSVFVFFGFIHPTTIFNGDEWFNLSLGREAWPEWHGFNPIKVVPEVSFPLLINVASFTLTPFGLTFLQSATFFTAALIAVLVVVYLRQFYLFTIEKMHCSQYSGLIIAAFHYLCLFGLFRTLNDSKSTYMLWELNITCYYHYLFPALINGSVALYFLRKGRELKGYLSTNPVLSGFIVLSVYLSIYSNIFSNLILAVTCGAVLLVDFVASRYKIVETIKSYPLHVLVLAMWVVSAIFEANGGRAERMGKSTLNISGAVDNALSLLSQMNGTFSTLIFVGIAACIFGCIASGKFQIQERKLVLIGLISSILIFTALTLISAKSSAEYIGKPVVMWGVLMYMIVLSSFGFSLLFRSNYASYLSPLIILMLVNASTNQSYSLKEPQSNLLTYQRTNAVTQDMIEQVQAALSENKREMILYVPKFDSEDNWPIPITRAREISWTLKSNGVIDKNISIRIQPDRKKNIEFDVH
ncbi:TPA: hypothetical protein R8F93_001559 [Enterobacter soli]|uniref:Uncharacterized protein n=1 Tax=Enterobacter soli TaxID=885040 RepID=A0AAW8H592_9ENTR|nr:hypothetical protein [Enterobacter soli]MDQ2255112.1 hypothetical protein [Enterobacter soli]MDQ2337031.1 hypothetical protein [Enterobacter soli]HEE9787548.1 hypothetical protein [Enterobacter soli]